MPMFKIYVGNLDPRVKIEHVRELFSPFAVIEDAVLAADAKTGKLKGFAIIMIRDAEIGRAAVKATQGKRLMGKTLTINEVVKKGKGAAAPAPAARQGPFGPHFNKQGGGRFGGGGGGTGGRFGGSARRGMNRGLRGPSAGAPRPSFGAGSGPGLAPGSGSSPGPGSASGPASGVGRQGMGEGDAPRSPYGTRGSAPRSPSDEAPPKRDGVSRPPSDGSL